MSYPATAKAEGPEPVMHAPVEGVQEVKYDIYATERRGDDIYTSEKREEVESSSLRKRDVESTETDIKVEQGVNGSEELSEEEEEKPGKIKMFIMRHEKEIRVAIHVIIGAVMTG